MLDIQESKINNNKSQQFPSENNADTVITQSNSDSVINRQTNDKSKALDDDTIYDNMIFPS